jgi:hypothetical protein
MRGLDPRIPVDWPQTAAAAWIAGPSPRRSGFGRAGGSSPAMTGWIARIGQLQKKLDASRSAPGNRTSSFRLRPRFCAPHFTHAKAIVPRRHRTCGNPDGRLCVARRSPTGCLLRGAARSAGRMSRRERALHLRFEKPLSVVLRLHAEQDSGRRQRLSLPVHDANGSQQRHAAARVGIEVLTVSFGRSPVFRRKCDPIYKARAS